MTSADPSFPQLHRTHARGWINDPNGICRIGDRWHVFFQYNPDSTVHHRIRWGHMSSPDLVSWRAEADGPVPQEGEADSAGCWSGVAVVDDQGPALVYSGISTERDEALSTAIVVRAEPDMRTMHQPGIVVAGIPDIPGLAAVRDPFVFTAFGKRWGLQGAGIDRGGTLVSAVLLYDATDLEQWQLLGPLVMGDLPVAVQHARADVWECPQLACVDGQWVLLLSRWFHDAPLRGGPTDVAYLLGDLEALDADGSVLTEEQSGAVAGLRFVPRDGGAMDHGPDFYAPQAVVDPKGERVLVWGWSWESEEEPRETIAERGWAGTLTFPRELGLHRGADGQVRLVGRAPQELVALRGAELEATADHRSAGRVDLPAAAEVEVRGEFSIHRVLPDGRESTVLPRHATAGARPDGAPFKGAEAPITRIFVDGNLLEVLPFDAAPHTRRVPREPGDRLLVRAYRSVDDLRGWVLG